MKPSFDVFVASLTLAAALAISALSYARLQAVETPHQEMLQNLPLGTHEYVVLEKKNCVGKISSGFSVEPQMTITSNAEMHFSVRGKPVVAKAGLGAFFNVFDQLVACNMFVQTEKANVSIKLVNPSPISVSVSYTLSGTERQQTFELPGPLLLKENADGSYRLDYSAFTGSLGAYASSFNRNPVNNFDFKVIRVENGKPICTDFETQAARVDLDPLIEQARAFITQVRQLPFLFSIPGDL